MDEALITAVLIFLSAVDCTRVCSDQEYFSNEELLKRLDNMAANEPSLASTYTIGFSGLGTELRVLRITAAPEDALVPQVKLVGGIHGDEPPSTHILVNYAQYLIESYINGEVFVTWLLNNTRIHILPRLNPDGFNEALEGECTLGPGRKNANGADLNRAFPRAHMSDDVIIPQFQPEVEAVMRWSEEERFAVGAGLHTGALAAVYPLDSPLGAMDLADIIDSLDLDEVLNTTTFEPTSPAERDGEKAKTRDDDIFVHMAHMYASKHITMSAGLGCDGRDRFRGGVVNGAEWYRASGSMMDYNYLYAGTMELTLELYCCKYPAPRLLCHIWEQNRLSLLKLSSESIRGVRGVVTSSGIPLEMATITVLGRDMVVSTNSKGQFFRVLLSGRYFLQVEMIGMKTKIIEVEIAWQNTAFYTWTEVNVDLQPDIPTSAPDFPEVVTSSRLDEEGTLTPDVYGTAETDFTQFPEELATTLYDKGGLDPDPMPLDTSFYSEEIGRNISIDLLARKMSSSGTVIPSCFFYVVLSIISTVINT